MPGITTIRHDEPAARQLLQDFIFGGKFGPGRVPRGIDPAFVSAFIQGELQPGSSADAYGKTLEAIRFYERADVLPHLFQALSRKELDASSIRRSAYVLQAAGDLGAPPDIVNAADYLDSVLVPLEAAMDVMPILFDTHVVLAPAHSADRLSDRIHHEVAQAALTEQQSEAHMMAYDRLSAMERNDLPRARAVAAKKVAVIALPADARRDELVTIYLGQSSAVGLLVETWAARALRWEALAVDPVPVWAALARAIDAADKATLPRHITDFTIVRAAQAILYLGGTLSQHHADLYAKAESAAASFLWDDP